jgi:peptide/nickel transport system substrate-binding protein
MSQHKTTRLSRRQILAGGAASTSFLLAGCTSGGESGSGSTDGSSDTTDAGDSGGPDPTLYVAQVKGPLDMDPVVINDVPSGQIAGQIFDGLYEYGEDVSIQPRIAADMPTVEREGTRYIVPLREGATFHNGDPLTADDVVHTMTAPVDEQTANASEVNMIDTAEAVDEMTVQFDLKYPYGAFTTAMVRSVVNASVRREDPAAYNQEPVGSGPFRLVEWEPENYATVERVDDYWDADSRPAVAGIEFDPIEEQTTRVTELETGNVDIIETIPPQLYETVEGNQNAQITESPGVGYYYLAFNCANGPTSDPRVREAIDYCFSMDQAIENFVEPSGVRQYSPYPASIAAEWEFPVDEWASIPHDQDTDAATSLFEEAGVSTDYEWRIIVPPDDMREQIGITIGDGLQNAGFENVEVQRLNWGTFLETYQSDEGPNSEDAYNMYTLGWSGSPDPDAFAYYLLSQQTNGVTNGTFHGYDEASAMLTQARESADYETRRERYIDATTQLLEARVHLPAYNLNNSYGVNDAVDGFSAHPIATEVQVATDHTTVSVSR